MTYSVKLRVDQKFLFLYNMGTVNNTEPTVNRKIPDSVRHNSDTNLRLAVRFLENALRAAKRGQIKEMCADVRIAAEFEKDIVPALRYGRIDVVD